MTRMHSSRMRTARSLLYRGGLPDRDPSGQTPPLDRKHYLPTTSFASGKNDSLMRKDDGRSFDYSSKGHMGVFKDCGGPHRVAYTWRSQYFRLPAPFVNIIQVFHNFRLIS